MQSLTTVYQGKVSGIIFFLTFITGFFLYLFHYCAFPVLNFLIRVMVLRDLLHHLFAMGLQNHSETTMGLLSCLIGYQEFHDLDVNKMQKWFQSRVSTVILEYLSSYM